VGKNWPKNYNSPKFFDRHDRVCIFVVITWEKTMNVRQLARLFPLVPLLLSVIRLTPAQAQTDSTAWIVLCPAAENPPPAARTAANLPLTRSQIPQDC